MFQLQQEKKKLQEDFSALLQDREMLEKRCATIQREQTQLGPRLEETKWEVRGKKESKNVYYTSMQPKMVTSKIKMLVFT